LKFVVWFNFFADINFKERIMNITYHLARRFLERVLKKEDHSKE
jgi:hypothetical protein